MAQQPPPEPQGVPESIVFSRFDGLKNTVDRERLGPRDLATAFNVDLDDDGQLHRRRGQTQVATGNFHSLWNANDWTLYGVKNGTLGVINPDYSFLPIRMGVGGDYSAGQPNISYVQVDTKIYYSCPTCTGIIDHPTKISSAWGPVEDFWLSPVVDPTGTLPPVAGRRMGAPPNASILAYYNGRIYLAADRTLWATEPYAYTLVNKTRGFVQFEDAITMVGAVGDGIYVGTDEGVWFLAGGSFETLKRTRVMDSPAIRGSMVYIPAELANPPQVRGAVTPMEVSIAFMTTRGFCVGEDSGKATNLTEATYFFPVADRATAFFRRQDGMNQYIVNADSGGEPVNGARIGDYIDTQIIRGVGAPAPSPLPLDIPGEGGFTGFGAVVYNATFAQALSANTPWQLTFTGASGVTSTDALEGVVVNDTFWNGSLLTPPSNNSVFLVKVVLTVTPLVSGGYVDVGIGPTNTPPFANEATLNFNVGSGSAQQFTFTFPILASAAFTTNGGYIMISSSVPAEITSVRLGIYPLST